jgi:hypothetical protein
MMKVIHTIAVNRQISLYLRKIRDPMLTDPIIPLRLAHIRPFSFQEVRDRFRKAARLVDLPKALQPVPFDIAASAVFHSFRMINHLACSTPDDPDATRRVLRLPHYNTCRTAGLLLSGNLGYVIGSDRDGGGCFVNLEQIRPDCARNFRAAGDALRNVWTAEIKALSPETRAWLGPDRFQDLEDPTKFDLSREHILARSKRFPCLSSPPPTP